MERRRYKERFSLFKIKRDGQNSFSSKNVVRLKKPRKRFKVLAFIFLFLGIVILSFSIARCEDDCGEDLLYFFRLSEYKNYIIKPYVAQASTKNLRKKLEDKNLKLTRVISETDSLIIVLIDKDLAVIFSKEKDIDWQINSLESLVKKLIIENKKPTKIDFSFEKPIVNFKSM